MKYESYHQVYSYTGYGLDKLEEKNGTYYTESGENILDVVDSTVAVSYTHLHKSRRINICYNFRGGF